MSGEETRFNPSNRSPADRSQRQMAFKKTKSQQVYFINKDEVEDDLDLSIEDTFFVPEPVSRQKANGSSLTGSDSSQVTAVKSSSIHEHIDFVYEPANGFAYHSPQFIVQRSPPRSTSSDNRCGDTSRHRNKKSFGNMLTSFRKGIIRTMSPSVNSHQKNTSRSRSSPVKTPPEERNKKKREAYVKSPTVPKLGSMKRKFENKIGNIKHDMITSPRKDQLSSCYIKDLTNESDGQTDPAKLADDANGEKNDRDKTDDKLTQSMFRDVKKEIDLLEQVANLGDSLTDVTTTPSFGQIEIKADNLINRTRQGHTKNIASFDPDEDENLDQVDSELPVLSPPPTTTTPTTSISSGGGSKSSKLISAIKKSFGETVSSRAVSFQQQSSVTSDAQSIAQTVASSTTQQLLTPTYFELRVRLKEGKNLAVRDVGGSSDPYAKFLLNGLNVFKSKIVMKNLNPQWNEEFTIKLSPSTFSSESSPIGRVNSGLTSEAMSLMSSPSGIGFSQNQLDFFLSKFKLKMFVYDYDRGFLSDDLIGYAAIDLIGLKDNLETSVEIELEDEKLAKYEYLGLITMDLLLTAKYKDEENDNQSLQGAGSPKLGINSPMANVRGKRAPYQLWQCILNVVLIEGNNLLSMDDNGLSDPYVKFKLENERYRSKTMRRTLNPRFLEQFQLYIYDMNKSTLMLTVFDHDSAGSADDFMGKAQINLKTLEYEKTHLVKLPLEDGAGTISLLLTITGTYGSDSPSDIEHYKENNKLTAAYRDEMIKQYSLVNSLRNIDDIGWLQVKVLRAEGLPSADINGKSDPFVTLQLINQFVQTHTEYKNLNPEWGKIYEFNVTDIHAILEINVLDEDKNKVYEFLGKLEIPIINIINGKRKFYALKDRKLLSRTKGAIELEMNLIYNPVKAVYKTFNPRENKLVQPEPKLKIPILKQNIMRVGNIAQSMVATGVFIDSCFRWISPIRSIIAFLAFCFIVLNFEIYMLPLTLLMIFLKNYIILKFKSVGSSTDDDDSSAFDYFEEGEEDNMDVESKEPKKSFRERLNEIQEICLKVQDTLDFVASLGERIINTFLFVSPWLSWLAIIVLTIATIILYTVPLRYLILVWGINKFTKKFRKPPDFVDNTEILDFLSRVPSKREYFQYKDLKYDKSNLMLSSTAAITTSASAKKKKKQ